MKSFHSFSLIIACYNGQEFVTPCLSSIVRQDYPKENFEILFINDGSQDNSLSIASNFQKEHPHLVIHSIENSGLEKACNLGIRQARHDWVVRVDVDDMLAPGFLAAMNEAMIHYPNFDFYYCKKYYEYYSETEKFLKMLPPFDSHEIFERGDFFATGTAYRKKCLIEAGYYPENVKNCGLENYHLILKLLTQGKSGFPVEDACFFYRRHHSNMSTVKRAAIIQYGKELLSCYGRMYKTNQYHPYGLQLSRDAL